MINEKFILVGVCFSLIGSLTYSYHTIKGRTQPNRITWAIWALAPFIAFFAQLSEGVGFQAVLTFSVGFGPLLIFASSFVNKKAYWKISKRDMACGVFAILALILWLIFNNGMLAIALALGADFLAGVPTFIKAFRNPETEHTSAFRNAAINSFIALLTIDHWNFETWSFPAYIFTSCILTYILVKFKIGPKLSAKKVV